MIQNIDITTQVQEIKRSFRLLMDGATAASMRQKGVDYKLNWGASLVMLRQQAAQFQPSRALAIALWKEDVRECKILATLLMPPEQCPRELAELWMEQTPNVEIAEQAAFNLYQHLPYAAFMAFQWIATDEPLRQLCGFHILSRLFSQGREPMGQRTINEFVDQAIAALHSPHISVRKAAQQSLLRFAELGLVYERIATSAMKRSNLKF